MARARVRRVGVGLALVAALFAVPLGIRATTASAAVPTKCCVRLPSPTLGLFPTSGPQFSAVQVFGSCGVTRPPDLSHLYGGTYLQNFFASSNLPPPKAGQQIVASWNGYAADDGSYNDDLTWDPNQTVVPGAWYFGFTYCAQWTSDDLNTAKLLYMVGPSAAAWFCVTGPNVPNCSFKLSGAALQVATGLAYAGAYVHGWLHLPSPASAPGSNAPPPTQPPPPPPPTTRPSPPRSSTTSTTSTTTTTTTTTTPPRRVQG